MTIHLLYTKFMNSHTSIGSIFLFVKDALSICKEHLRLREIRIAQMSIQSRLIEDRINNFSLFFLFVRIF